MVIWEWMDSGGSHGLQIHCWVVKPAEVGSIPTHSRHFSQVHPSFYCRLTGGENMTDKDILRLTHMSSKAG